MTQPILAAENLVYAAGRRRLVDDVSLVLAPGSLAVLVGPNGAGKSTLLRLLTGEIRPISGEVRLDGRPLGAWPGWRLAAKRAILPQSSRLAFAFTVAELVAIGVDGIGQGLSARDRSRIAAEAIAAAELTTFADASVDRLSGGERQRAHLARVLAQLAAGASIEGRQVLFLDEPTAGLDIRHQMALLETARTVARAGNAVLAIIHDLHLAMRYADMLFVMREGRLAAHGAVGPGTPAAIAGAFGVEPEHIPVLAPAEPMRQARTARLDLAAPCL